MILYQFYEGKMSDETREAINDLKSKAERAGWQHELYDLQRFLTELEDNDLRECLRRMWRYLPPAMAGSATSDFFRFWSLQLGGLYCDDDVYCTTSDFPSLPTEGVWTTSEQTRTQNLNTAITLCNGVQGMLYSRLLTYWAAERLKQTWLGSFDDCKNVAAQLTAAPYSLIGYLGPGWVRATLPHLAAQGVTVQRFPFSLSSSHDPTSILWHGGRGAWCFGG